MTEQPIHIPQAWQQLDLSGWRGTVLIIGAPDVGKSTLAHYLYGRLRAEGRTVAYLDGDPGQSTLGPPATMTLAVSGAGDKTFPPQGQFWRSFIGAVSPRGHMLPLVIGGLRLVRAAGRAGAELIIYDTCGLVDPVQGGLALKLAKIDLLQPGMVCALQRERELEPLLQPLRRSRRTRLVDLRPSPTARTHDVAARQAHRAAQFGRYFANARGLSLTWTRLAVFPGPHFTPNRLVALEDAAGFTLGLGIVIHHDRRARQVTLQTPLTSLSGVDALRLGDFRLDPETFQDQRLESVRPH